MGIIGEWRGALMIALAPKLSESSFVSFKRREIFSKDIALMLKTVPQDAAPQSVLLQCCRQPADHAEALQLPKCWLHADHCCSIGRGRAGPPFPLPSRLDPARHLCGEHFMRNGLSPRHGGLAIIVMLLFRQTPGDFGVCQNAHLSVI